MVILKCILRSKTRFLRYFSHSESPIKMKVLSVAEKNDAAKTLASFMSNNIRRREGFSKFNKIYEFDCTLFGQKCDMIMTSVSGHLLGLEFVGAYRQWKSCSPLTLFDAPVTKQCISGYEDIKRTLEREIRKCSVLIIWTDCDREGENIGFEVIEVCKAVKPNIRIYRAKFSEITGPSVRRALQNLAQPDKRINDAVEVRQELDLRIGAAFTRFQTLRLQQVFPQNLSDALLSYGSCQFPTLGFVVERYKAIENFIPENFWKIKVIHKVNDLSVEFVWKRGRLFDEIVCQCFHDVCVANPIATVQSVNSKPKSRWRPLPLDTVELEKVGSRKLKINAKEIMRIAERLYTQGFISYPRTETNIFPKELDLSNLIAMQTSDQNWGEFANRVLRDGPNPRNGNKSDKAHPPIHPTKYTNNLGGHEQRVYEFVVRRFLACCSKDAEGHETIVEINIADEIFVANGLMIMAKNFLEVYPYEKWNAKEIHVYQVGQRFTPNIEMVDSITTAPQYLTEADLIALMEKHGIGTDATHADHIETIKSRLYVGLENEKYFVPGHLGMGLVEGYDSMGFPMSKPHLRAELESDLVKICEGKKNPEIVLKEQLSKYKQVFEVALQQAAKIDEALAVYLQEQPRQPEINIDSNPNIPCTVMPCPSCGGNMALKTKKDGIQKYVSCMSFPSCKNAVWFPQSVESVEVTEETCRMCGPKYKKLQFRFRRGAMSPLFNSEEILCIGGCDQDLLEIMNIPINSVRKNSQSTQSSSFTSGISSFFSSSRNVSDGSRNNDSGVVSASNANGFVSSATLPRNTANVGGGRIDRNTGNGIGRSTGSGMGRNSDNGNDWNTGSGIGRNTGSGIGRNTGNGIGRGAGRGRDNRLGNFSNSSHAIGPGDNVPAPSFVSNDSFGAFQNNSSRTTGSTVQDDDMHPVVCKCNENAILLVVKKEGPNKGRQFYKCDNRRGSNCGFFLWADSPPDTGQGDGNSYSNRSRQPTQPQPPSYQQPQSGMQWGSLGPATDDDTVYCRCGGPARGLIVQKEGPNKGRPFYSCPKSVDKCNFFAWADEGSSSSSSGPSSNWRGNNQGNGRKNQTNPSDAKRKRKCTNCREEGHTKRNCPSNNANS